MASDSLDVARSFAAFVPIMTSPWVKFERRFHSGCPLSRASCHSTVGSPAQIDYFHSRAYSGSRCSGGGIFQRLLQATASGPRKPAENGRSKRAAHSLQGGAPGPALHQPATPLV